MRVRTGIAASAACAFALFVCAGCGGGSSGTGTGDGNNLSLQGTVETSARAPVSGVTVTVVETGDQTVTDSAGSFSLQVTPPENGLQVQVAAPSIEGVIDASTVDSSDSTVDLNIVVDPKNNTVSADKLEVQAGIVGLCDAYFDNGRVITQVKAAPRGAACTAKVTVHRNGRARANVPIAVQFHSCADDNWVAAGASKTLSGVHAGVGQVSFQFFDDAEHCIYRIVVPASNIGSGQFVEYDIVTFTQQSIDAVSGK
jgi:hypothetical protein